VFGARIYLTVEGLPQRPGGEEEEGRPSKLHRSAGFVPQYRRGPCTYGSRGCPMAAGLRHSYSECGRWRGRGGVVGLPLNKSSDAATSRASEPGAREGESDDDVDTTHSGFWGAGYILVLVGQLSMTKGPAKGGWDKRP
jgi:hypothetical protein